MKTSVPFTYIIDYGKGILGVLKYIKLIEKAPPTLLHVGHDVPFKSGLGAVIGDAPDCKVLSPQGTVRRIKEVTKFVADLHKAGVKIIIPYICNQTIAGDHKKRLGFWEFYDRWEEYSQFGFSKKPKEDPIEWMQRESSLELSFSYSFRFKLFHPLFRYMPCPNNDSWQSYLLLVVENIAKCGYDGVFVDNNIIHCYCKSCQRKFKDYLTNKYSAKESKEKFSLSPAKIKLDPTQDKVYWVKQDRLFKKYLREKYSPAELKERFYSDKLSDKEITRMGYGFLWREVEDFLAALPDKRKLAKNTLAAIVPESSEKRLLWAEVQLFWAESIRQLLARIKQKGEEFKGDFLVIPNWGAMGSVDDIDYRRRDGKNVATYARVCRHQMFEEDWFKEDNKVSNYIFQYKFAYANKVKAILLPYIEPSLEVTDLSYAEASASGGSVFVQCGYKFPQIRKKYLKFFNQHKELYADLSSYAEVGLFFFFNQLHLENLNHLKEVYKIKDWLSNHQILFDLIIEDLALKNISYYKVIILPYLEHLSNRQLKVIKDYQKKGGKLIVSGKTGQYDENGKIRELPFEEERSYARKILVNEQVFTQYLNKVCQCRSLIVGKNIPEIRCNAYLKKKGKTGLLVLHLVNYNLPLKKKEKEPAVIKNVPLSLRIPSGGKVLALSLHTPEVEESKRLNFGSRGEVVSFIIPEVKVYKVVKIELSLI